MALNFITMINSTQPNSDKPSGPKLWTIERFRDEVEAVRKGLGLEQFYLLGHSWGGMLAMEYTLIYPQYLKRVDHFPYDSGNQVLREVCCRTACCTPR